jgi:ribose/xylose/arabinose/galactoside ABC-type transport system permease subunit
MLLASGMTLVIATGGVDLSVGAIMAIAASVAALMMNPYVMAKELRRTDGSSMIPASPSSRLDGHSGHADRGDHLQVVNECYREIQPMVASSRSRRARLRS